MKAESKIILHRKSINIYYSDSRGLNGTQRRKFYLPTGIQLKNEKDFSKATATLKGQYAHLNAFVWDLKQKVDGYIKEAISNHSNDIVSYLNQQKKTIQNKFDSIVEHNSLQLDEQYLIYYNKEYKDSTAYTYTTKQDYYTLWFDLVDYIKTSAYTTIGDISTAFIDDIFKWYVEVRNISPKTLIKKKTYLNKFMKYLKIDSDIIEYSRNYDIVTYDKDVIPYSNDELDFIKSYQPISDKEQLLIDLTLFSVYVGCNFSDMVLLNKYSISKQNGVQILTYNRQKTKSVCQVPLSSIALDIFKKYDYNLNRISNQKYNDGIKLLLQRFKPFQNTIRIKDTKTGRDINVVRWTLLTHRTARQTFITKCLDKNVNQKDIIQMVGHVDFDMLRYYMSKRIDNVPLVKNILDTF